MSTTEPANTEPVNTAAPQPDQPDQPDQHVPTSTGAADETAQPPARNHGLGRIIVAIYGVFALSATARAAYQMATDFERAPLAYILSAVAALVYIVATVSLAKTGTKAYAISTAAIIFELIGVLVIGALTEFNPELFPVDTVWSHFGSGYGYVPLALPIIGLAWLYFHRRRR